MNGVMSDAMNDAMSEQDLRKKLLVPNVGDWLKFCKKNYRRDRALTVKIVENGVILPARPVNEIDPFKCNGGVCDRDLNFVDGHNDVIDDPWNGNYVLRDAFEVKPDEIVTSDETVIYGGAMIRHFGHFITESFARLWYVVQHPELNTRIAFVAFKANSMQVHRPWINKLLDLMGIADERILIIEKPTRFRSIIVPEQSLYFRDCYSDEFFLPYKAILSRIRPGSARKIFLSRSSSLQSMVTLNNQEYFEEFYRARGFSIVYPEKLSISDQIALVSGADEIVTFLGTLSHWALFCRPQTKFTMLTRVDSTTDFHETIPRQCLINAASDTDWRIVSVARNFLFALHGLGECLLGVTEYWKRYVLERFGETIDDDNIPIEIVNAYIERWCKFFSTEIMLPYRIATLRKLRFENDAMRLQIAAGHAPLCYDTYIANFGWSARVLDGNIAGASTKPLSIRALRIYFLEPFLDVFYTVRYADDTWTTPVSNGAIAGAIDKDKTIRGVQIQLRSTDFDVLYSVHMFNGIWSDWAKNGAKLFADQDINAIRIKIVPRGADKS